mgnify:CR=1 FL=1
MEAIEVGEGPTGIRVHPDLPVAYALGIAAIVLARQARTVEQVTLGKAGGGTATAALDFSRSSPTQNRTTLQAALTTLYGAGNVLVIFDQSSTAASPRYFIDFTNDLAYQNIGQIEVRSQSGVTVAVSTSREGSNRTSTPTTQSVSTIQKVTLANPVVYLVSGFRWSFFDIADVSVGVSLAMIAVFLGLCLGTVWWIFKSGYRLKA